jgi:hypothetical protein
VVNGRRSEMFAAILRNMGALERQLAERWGFGAAVPSRPARGR